jgi:hypothetical protein
MIGSITLWLMVCCAGVSFGLTLKNPIFFPVSFWFCVSSWASGLFLLYVTSNSASPPQKKNASQNEDFHESAGRTQFLFSVRFFWFFLVSISVLLCFGCTGPAQKKDHGFVCFSKRK